MRGYVVGPVGHSSRTERVLRGAELDEVGLLDPGVRVAPLPADQRHALVGLEVDDRVGPARQELRWAWGACGWGGNTGGHHAPTFTTKYRNGSDTSVNW